ncbi:iron-sulfur cluster insertion protein ErpA [Marinibactrum halimedae]|uniref:Iron-sulfur cluster insertion protein ErpA n=1 Tax=Marinibactrum halimedae TaxID=1444977 RepID=A0AA37T513_9GAMM|nr:iron-sulfur cluster insertion protein ErpA [Marinibactrum halimedae]MCD9460493.1 iron-sulfur cluster insertion protein ErpA [Marinibactrum halimedae]GLS25899.1 iron-sulfur cluster insertion protein ErpA [Marinibactrum halimedae]
MSTEAYAVDEAAILVTESAVSKVKELIEDEGNDDLKLRVFVTGGGCSGFQYGFTFDELVGDEDSVVESGGIRVLVDSLSYPFLSGATVDYEQGLAGSKFVITNPNASSTCGCGSSFSV